MSVGFELSDQKSMPMLLSDSKELKSHESTGPTGPLVVGVQQSPREAELLAVRVNESAMRNREQGFSLIELLIVVAIILIIAAVAIPNFLRAKITANESSAVSSLHAIDTAEISYESMYGAIGYSVALSDLGQGAAPPCPGIATASCFIDSVLASGTKAGYKFTYVQTAGQTPALGFTINADPVMLHLTGERGLYSDESNVIRYATGAVANSASPPL